MNIFKREISWESQHIELTGEDVDENEEVNEVYDDGFSEEKEMPAIMSTPWGPFRVNDKMNPYRQFEFWMGHTNFNIDKEAKDILDNTLGVEVLFIISPLRFMVAKGKMFEWRDVRIAIEKGLCGKHVADEQIESIQDPDICEKIGKLKEDLIKAFDHWAIYVFPNGECMYTYTKDETPEEFERFLNDVLLYEQSEELSGGILLQSDIMQD